MAKVKIKICGMTRQKDIEEAISLGVDAFGLIFYEKSARFVTVKQAQKLLRDLPPFVAPVAVLVNPEEVLVEEIINTLPVQYLQFHGEEKPEFCEKFNKPYLKAIAASSSEVINQAMINYKKVSAILVDTPGFSQRGGTGISFDWKIVPNETMKPLILAGGLNATNIIQAIQICNPYGIDVCSGVELSPGIKDHDKMKRFIQAIRRE